MAEARVVAPEVGLDVPLRHGLTVESVCAAAGYRLVRFAGADLVGAVVRIRVEVAPAEVPVVRQRLAAYAVVTSERGVLLTQLSDRTGAPGAWVLPGGGIDDREQPEDAVLREVWEETGQRVTLGAPLIVSTGHWTGQSPAGVLEDYHAVRLVWSATCAHPTESVVHDVGGTTQHAEWVPARRVTDLVAPGSWTREALDAAGLSGGQPVRH